MAAGLQARGIDPGDHVAILGPTTRSLVTAIQATWLAGATVVVLPLPMRMSSIEEFVAQTRDRVLNADRRCCSSTPTSPRTSNRDRATHRRSAADDAWRRPIRPVEPEIDPAPRLAIIQFTSGSTSEPKGVMLPHAPSPPTSTASSRRPPYRDEVLVSWLPLYHDMGLVGMLACR